MLIKKRETNNTLDYCLDSLQREHPYLTEKLGFSRETITDFEIGYCTEKQKKIFGHVIIPIHNSEGTLVAYARHRIDKVDECGSPQYEFSFGYKKTSEVFNLYRATKEVTARPLIIVRDLFDVLHLYQNGHRNVIALMGDSMSQIQEELIRHNSNLHTRVILLLNQNQLKWSKKISTRLSLFCYVKVHVLKYPLAQPKKMTRAQIQKLF